MQVQVPAEDRFWAQVDRRGPDECWLWIGSIDGKGYGHLSILGRMYRAHRISWKLANGREPIDCVCHSCDNPICVNPAHLWEGDHTANMRDMVAKGRRRGAFTRRDRQSCRNGHPFIPENQMPNGRATTCRICREARGEQVSA